MPLAAMTAREVSTRSRPKAAECAVYRLLAGLVVSTRSRPKAADHLKLLAA